MRRFVLILALAACSKSSHKPKEETPLLVNAVGSQGQAAAEGWTRAHSKNGKFSVELPGPYDDVEQQIKSPQAYSVHVVALQKPFRRTKFVASRNIGRIEAEPFAGVLKIDGLVSKQEVTIAGHKGLDLVFKAKTNAMMRALALDDGLVLMVVESLEGATPVPEAEAKRFFDSFQLDAPAK